MQQIVLYAEAGELTAELARRGIAAHTRVHVTVELAETDPAMAAIAQAGRALDWLADEPDVYSDADLVHARAEFPPNRQPPPYKNLPTCGKLSYNPTMPIPIRTLRAHADDLPNARPILSARELDREDRILDTARALIFRFGRVNLTFHALAVAMRLAPATIRRHFPDLDSILSEIIIRHLRAIACALGEVPRDHPNRQAAARAAYITFTRNGMGCAPTEAHTLLIRERHTLPPDLLEHIEQLRDLIGTSFAKDHIETTLALLDNCFLQPPQIEAMLATLQNPSAALPKIKSITYPQNAHTTPQMPPSRAFPPPPPQARAGPRVATG